MSNSKLVAFYATSNKSANRVIAYRVPGRAMSFTKTIPQNIWTIIEEISDSSQIVNSNLFGKLGVTTYVGEFMRTPPFGVTSPRRFAVMKTGASSPFFLESYSEFLGSSKLAATTVKNASLISQFEVSKVDFASVNFSKVDWGKVDFSSAKVYKVDFSKINISDLIFDKVDFSKVSAKADLLNVDFSKVNWSDMVYSNAAISLVSPELYSFRNVDFTKADFSKVNFFGTNFDKVDLKAFSTSKLSDVKNIFNYADYSTVNFSKINFDKVDLIGTIFSNEKGYAVSFNGAGYFVDLTSVDFSVLDFSRVDFAGLNFVQS